jgi:MOSC domain-containing protein YiiM
MTVEHIFTRPCSGRLSVEHQSVVVHAGAGIEGDRYFNARDEPGQNITFVEAEEIEAFALAHGRSADVASTGRNVVTRGVRLHELVGREFSVGILRFRGVELCEPCLGFGEALSMPSLGPPQVVRHWVHRAGLRASALSSGTLCVGATFESAARQVFQPDTPRRAG